MREVVLDPEVLAAGVLGRDRPRKLLGLLAYGRWVQYGGLLGSAEAALIEEELANGGGIFGPLTIEALMEQAHDQRAKLNELLDYGAPDDLVLVASERIIEAVLDRVEIARSVDPVARAQTGLVDVAFRTVRFLALGSVGSEAGPQLPTEGLRDHLVHVSALSSAPLVTDDEDLVLRDYRMWRHTDSQGGRPAIAVTTRTFQDAQVDRGPFSMDSVPYNLLDIAMGWIR